MFRIYVPSKFQEINTLFKWPILIIIYRILSIKYGKLWVNSGIKFLKHLKILENKKATSFKRPHSCLALFALFTFVSLFLDLQAVLRLHIFQSLLHFSLRKHVNKKINVSEENFI